MQITGPDIVPFDEVKQTALLSIVARILPRIAAGIGPRYFLHPRVEDLAENSTARASIIMLSTDRPDIFAQVRLCFGATAAPRSRVEAVAKPLSCTWRSL